MTQSSLFGTSGIRGDADKLFSDQFCFDLGRAFAIFLTLNKQSSLVAVGMDPRDSSPRIKNWVSQGLLYEGIEVFDQGVSPVPAINQILKSNTSLGGAIMISGSHIKPHLNGVKFFCFMAEILKRHEKHIEKIYLNIKEEVLKIRVQKNNTAIDNSANESYSNFLYSCAHLKYPAWTVVVDPGDGATSDVLPNFFRRIGLNVCEINSSVQGNFFSRDTEVEGDFKELQNEVVKRKANFGIGFDSDGDRAIFIDEKGNYIPGDFTGALIAKNVVGNSVVTPINTSSVVDYIGKKVIRTKVGSPHVIAAMQKFKSTFGFEANGGGIFLETMSRDGGRTAVEILNILAKNKCKFSQLFKELPKFYIARTKIDYEWRRQDEILDFVKKKIKYIKKDETDGLKLWINKSTWILFRSSQNAPEFRVFAESENETKANNLMLDGINLVKSALKNG